MTIEIWSDIACPFCYIGKRHLEQALEDFDHSNKVEITWHSFELDPQVDPDTDQDIYELLAKKYGQSLEWAKKANEDLSRKAADVGIEFNPDNIKPTNTFDAHRLIKMAEKKGLADEAEEQLFKAYFTDGRQIADIDTLLVISGEIGLNRKEVLEMLNGSDFETEVRSEEKEAQQLGIQGVPFFVINRKYAVQGAQPPHVFMEALEKAFNDHAEPSAAD